MQLEDKDYKTLRQAKITGISFLHASKDDLFKIDNLTWGYFLSGFAKLPNYSDRRVRRQEPIEFYKKKRHKSKKVFFFGNYSRANNRFRINKNGFVFTFSNSLRLFHYSMIMSNYELYFSYKVNKQYSFHEYVVYNLYTANFKAPYTTQKKNGFFSSYTNLIKKYSNLESYKLKEVNNFFSFSNNYF